MSDVQNKLHLEIKAAEVFKATLQDIAGDDVDLIRDMIEGETNLRPLIERADKQMCFDAALVDGVAFAIKTLGERKSRIEKRIEMTRAACLTAMEISEIKSLETPTGTLTCKAIPPSATITDEAAIPARFWEQQDPKIDKRAVLDALKAKEEIPGAELSNGGITLQIRR